MSLTKEMLSELSMDEKLDIIRGLCRGVMSLHNYEPPFYHRNICPEAFYIFNVKGKYKALLAKFDCTKDNSDDSSYTVFNNVEKRATNQNTNQFFAPEVLKSDMGKGVDWRKADIYSLGKTCLFILTGEIISENFECILDVIDISDDAKLTLFKMLSVDPADRPNIEDLLDSVCK